MNGLHAERLLERFAERLQQAGARHADVAAAVLAARGSARADHSRYARTLRIRVADLRRAEAGELSFDELPEPLRSAIERLRGGRPATGVDQAERAAE